MSMLDYLAQALGYASPQQAQAQPSANPTRPMNEGRNLQNYLDAIQGQNSNHSQLQYNPPQNVDLGFDAAQAASRQNVQDLKSPADIARQLGILMSRYQNLQNAGGSNGLLSSVQQESAPLQQLLYGSDMDALRGTNHSPSMRDEPRMMPSATAGARSAAGGVQKFDPNAPENQIKKPINYFGDPKDPYTLLHKLAFQRIRDLLSKQNPYMFSQDVLNRMRNG